MKINVEENWAAQLRIRDLEKQVRNLTAQNALLTTQLSQANEQIEALSTSKKRKRVKVNSNQKLTDFEAILHTQEAQELKRIEEENWAKRRAAEAKKTSKNAK